MPSGSVGPKPDATGRDAHASTRGPGGRPGESTANGCPSGKSTRWRPCRTPRGAIRRATLRFVAVMRSRHMAIDQGPARPPSLALTQSPHEPRSCLGRDNRSRRIASSSRAPLSCLPRRAGCSRGPRSRGQWTDPRRASLRGMPDRILPREKADRLSGALRGAAGDRARAVEGLGFSAGIGSCDAYTGTMRVVSAMDERTAALYARRAS